MVSQLFEKLQSNKKYFLSAESGQEFEDRVEAELRNIGFTKVLQKDFSLTRFKDIKSHTIEKQRDDFLDVAEHEDKRFIREPFGSQEYPDFLVFSDKKVIPIEIKYSKKKKSSPVWNSNLPKANGFYIFGAYGLQDVTFFCGKDILDPDRRKKLIKFFDEVKQSEGQFNEGLRDIDNNNVGVVGDDSITTTGFYAYVRIAYQQQSFGGRVFNYFTNQRRVDIETNALKYIKKLES